MSITKTKVCTQLYIHTWHHSYMYIHMIVHVHDSVHGRCVAMPWHMTMTYVEMCALQVGTLCTYSMYTRMYTVYNNYYTPGCPGAVTMVILRQPHGYAQVDKHVHVCVGKILKMAMQWRQIQAIVYRVACLLGTTCICIYVLLTMCMYMYIHVHVPMLLSCGELLSDVGFWQEEIRWWFHTLGEWGDLWASSQLWVNSKLTKTPCTWKSYEATLAEMLFSKKNNVHVHVQCVCMCIYMYMYFCTIEIGTCTCSNLFARKNWFQCYRNIVFSCIM